MASNPHMIAPSATPRSLDEIRVDFAAPPNVPKDRLVDLSFAMGSVPNDLVDPYEPFDWLAGPDIPPLLYNRPAMSGLAAAAAAGGGMKGNWVVTHYKDIDRVYTDNEHFSNKGTAEFQAADRRDLSVDPAGDRSARAPQVPPCS